MLMLPPKMPGDDSIHGTEEARETYSAQIQSFGQSAVSAHRWRLTSISDDPKHLRWYAEVLGRKWEEMPHVRLVHEVRHPHCVERIDRDPRMVEQSR